MKKRLPTVRDIVTAAREAKHDSFGIASDPEALIHLANVSRRAFLEQKALSALRDWAETVADVASFESSDPAILQWLAIEAVRLDKARFLVEELEKHVHALAIKLGAVGPQLDNSQREEVTMSLEVAWRTAGARGGAAEGRG